ENFPDIKDIRYKKHCTVMVIKVELKPGWTYHFGLNSSSDRNIISQKGIPLNPVSVTFKTRGKGPSSESTVPYVIEMIPENGAKGVDPELKEMLITFSEPMKDKSWSLTGSGENYPEIKSMYYKKNCTVLVLKMDLKPSWTYRFGINSPSYKNFMSRNGIPVEPVQVTFSTKGEKVVIARKDLPSLGKAEFSFEDSNGMEIRSADYKGVPLFITFGAAW
ncbi:MAG: Ig-like domain-containing protein, partial [Planctomycetota bacterium]